MNQDMYLTDRKNEGLELEALTDKALGALVGFIETKLASDHFARAFPEICPDGNAVCGTSKRLFSSRFNGEMKRLTWPISIPGQSPLHFRRPGESEETPKTESMLEMLEFGYAYCHKPFQFTYHTYFGHHHLRFDEDDDGKDEYIQELNLLLRRLDLTYQMNPKGQIEIQFDPSIEHMLSSGITDVEATLNKLIKESSTLIRQPKGDSHQTAIEKLWDAFERVKTLVDADKRKGAEKVLRIASKDCDVFYSVLKAEANSLTDIGNKSWGCPS